MADVAESIPAKRHRAAQPARHPAADASDQEWIDWATLWASWDPNLSTRKAVLNMVQSGSVGDLRTLLGSRLEFGTAGLRGPMGPGSARMNDLVVIQTTQGVCAYLEQVFGAAGKARGVVLGFDHRARRGCDSRTLATRAADVFLHKGFKVHFYDDFVATPLVPWALEQKQCLAGVMVTASHNPADDNGYKLYWENGAQIIPPHDAHIAKLIEENLEPWGQYGEGPLSHDPNFERIGAELKDKYFERLQAMSCFRNDNVALANDFKVVYTAMHGVGYQFVVRAFEVFGHGASSLVPVSAQIDPDPDFPTVAFPNPEEGKGALKMACDTAEAAGSYLVLANDPDADRLAVAERSEAGTWHIFTGNEIGALLGHWAWTVWRKANPDKDPSSVCVIASAVSSKFLEAVAKVEGFRFYETLTGFKWMGSKAAELREAGREVIFAFEEAIGFSVGDLVKDKDGVAAAAVFTEMAKQLRKERQTCLSHLRGLYDKYGHVLSMNSYVKSSDPELTRRIFERQRRLGATASDAGGSAPRYAPMVGGFAVTAVRDLTIGHDTRTANFKPDLPLNVGGEMITYYFDVEAAWVTLRTSGTEPKIKWYSEMRCAACDREAAQSRLGVLVREVVLQLLDPHGNRLDVRAEDQDLLK